MTGATPTGADGSAPFVLVLVPAAEGINPEIDYYYDFDHGRDEYARAFDALGMPWRWQKVTQRDHGDVLAAYAREMGGRPNVVLNLCDGDETNDVPGVSVIRTLRALGLTYTGAEEHFFQVTTSKIDMKRAFDAGRVATSPWAVVEEGVPDAEALFARLGSPLIVKPAVSAGSMGITIKSVVHDAAALREQVRILHDGYKGWNLVSGGVFVERYVAGPEYTALVVGSATHPERRKVYAPIERVFHHTLPREEQFLSYDRLWETYEREARVGGENEYLWEYAQAPASVRERVEQLSWEAHASVQGMGYSRVDLRMDAATGDLAVLEVNAQCGLSEDENYTSIGAILRYEGQSFAGLIGEIVDDALARRGAPHVSRLAPPPAAAERTA
jgi:D-alanine-D-alanine ligase